MFLIIFFTLSVVGILVLLVCHVNSVLYSDRKITPVFSNTGIFQYLILKSFHILKSNDK